VTEQEIRVKILDLLKSGEFTRQQIKEALWIESDRKLDTVLKDLRKERLIYYNGNGIYSLIEKPKKPRKVRKSQKNTISIVLLRIIFGVLSIGASTVSIRNTSRYLLESYPFIWGMSISILMSLFMVSAASMMVYFNQKKHYIKASGLGILWAIVTFYSMMSTTIGAYNFQKDSFVKKTSIEKIDNTNDMLYNEYQKQAEGIQKLIDDKTITLTRLNKEIIGYEAGTKQYNNTAWAITVAEREIKAQQEKLSELTDKRVAVVSKRETTEVVAKTFYEEMEGLFGVQAALIQFVLSLMASIFIDIIAPIGASLALFLKEE